MRVLSSFLVFVLFAVLGCTAELPTAELVADDAAASGTVLAKSEHAAGVVRRDGNFFLYFYDAETDTEFDLFDPSVYCNEGWAASRVKIPLQVVIKEDLLDDPDDPVNNRLHRVVRGQDLNVYVSSPWWTSCEDYFTRLDAGQIGLGTADVHNNDNDLNGWRDRQNANTWHWNVNGEVIAPGGEMKKLNIVTHCVWVDETEDVRCDANFVYN